MLSNWWARGRDGHGHGLADGLDRDGNRMSGLLGAGVTGFALETLLFLFENCAQHLKPQPTSQLRQLFRTGPTVPNRPNFYKPA